MKTVATLEGKGYKRANCIIKCRRLEKSRDCFGKSISFSVDTENEAGEGVTSEELSSGAGSKIDKLNDVGQVEKHLSFVSVLFFINVNNNYYSPYLT